MLPETWEPWNKHPLESSPPLMPLLSRSRSNHIWRQSPRLTARGVSPALRTQNNFSGVESTLGWGRSLGFWRFCLRISGKGIRLNIVSVCRVLHERPAGCFYVVCLWGGRTVIISWLRKLGLVRTPGFVLIRETNTNYILQRLRHKLKAYLFQRWLYSPSLSYGRLTMMNQWSRAIWRAWSGAKSWRILGYSQSPTKYPRFTSGGHLWWPDCWCPPGSVLPVDNGEYNQPMLAFRFCFFCASVRELQNLTCATTICVEKMDFPFSLFITGLGSSCAPTYLIRCCSDSLNVWSGVKCGDADNWNDPFRYVKNQLQCIKIFGFIWARIDWNQGSAKPNVVGTGAWGEAFREKKQKRSRKLLIGYRVKPGWLFVAGCLRFRLHNPEAFTDLDWGLLM